MTVLNIQSLFITHVSGISVLCPVVSLSSREAWTSYIEAQGSTREYPKSEHSKREERKLLVLLKARSRTGTVSLCGILWIKSSHKPSSQLRGAVIPLKVRKGRKEDFPGGPLVRNPPANARDKSSIPGPG